MTRHCGFGGLALGLVFSLASCSRPEVGEGNAAAIAPGASADTTSTDARVAIADTARIQGNSAAKVWLVMASDFQCPACKHWHDKYAAEIMQDYVATGKVRFAYTNFPLDHIHANARAASEAAMCAAAQGRFWDVHDRLFAAQQEWAASPDPVPQFRQFVRDAGVDTVSWNQCLTDDVMLPLIDADQERGRAGGVNQTPYFFVGSQKVGGAIPANVLRPLLDSAIAQAGGARR